MREGRGAQRSGQQKAGVKQACHLGSAKHRQRGPVRDGGQGGERRNQNWDPGATGKPRDARGSQRERGHEVCGLGKSCGHLYQGDARILSLP